MLVINPASELRSASEPDLNQDEFYNILKDNSLLSVMAPDDWQAIESKHGPEVYSDYIFLMTRLRFETGLAKVHFFKIISHLKELNKLLGRDIGIRVALFDYFINVDPKIKEAIIIDNSAFVEQMRYGLVDHLTGLYNRRYFNNVLYQEIENSKRFDEPLSVLIIDLDNFKSYNDSFGHTAGDRLLSAVACVLCSTARSIDHIIRYGGDEFAVILPRTGKNAAAMAAERQRKSVEAIDFEYESTMSSGRVTISIGVATFPDDALGPVTLINRADQALYRAKRNGRNQSFLWGDEYRAYPRYQYENSLTVSSTSGQIQREVVQSIDISLGGVKIEISKPMRLGSRIEISLKDQRTDCALNLQGDAVWVQKDPNRAGYYFLGLSFINTNQEDDLALRRIVESLAAS